MLGAFSPSFPLISFRFLSVRLVTSPPQAKAPSYPFLKSLVLLWIPTILTLYINTTLVVPLCGEVDESFSGSKMSCISLFENLVQYDHLLLWSYMGSTTLINTTIFLKPNGHHINTNFILLNRPCFLCGPFNIYV